jgi:fibronectin-binding autotransporter adhesin
MPAKISLSTILATLFVTVCCTATSSAARAGHARLTIAGSKVSVAGQPAAAGTTISAGDTIVTGSGSRAELTLPDGTVVRLGQGSSFTYTGSKLVLNQGTALIRVAHKNTTVTAGSRTYTGGPAVVSAQASKGSDGLFVLQGSGKVNGAPLIAGQTSVLEKGKDRTFTFDLQKLVGSSALVTKFPQAPWVAETAALASVQHQLLTAKITPASQPGKGVASRDIVSSSLANRISTGVAGSRVSGVTGNQFTGGAVSLGANSTAVIKSATVNSATNGGTLQLVGSVITTGGATVSAISGTRSTTSSGSLTINAGVIDTVGAITKTGAGTLRLSGATLNTGAAGAVVSATNNFVLNTGILSSSGTAGTLAALTTGGTTAGVLTVANANTTGGASAIGASTSNGLIKTGAGTLTVAGANTYTDATTVNAGNLISQSASAIGGTLVLNGGSTFSGLVQSGTILNVNGVQTPIVAGQTLTIHGVNYIATPVTGGGASPGTLNLQQVTH